MLRDLDEPVDTAVFALPSPLAAAASLKEPRSFAPTACVSRTVQGAIRAPWLQDQSNRLDVVLATTTMSHGIDLGARTRVEVVSAASALEALAQAQRSLKEAREQRLRRARHFSDTEPVLLISVPPGEGKSEVALMAAWDALKRNRVINKRWSSTPPISEMAPRGRCGTPRRRGRRG